MRHEEHHREQPHDSQQGRTEQDIVLEPRKELVQLQQTHQLQQADQSQHSEQLGGAKRCVRGAASEERHNGIERKRGEQVDGEPPAQIVLGDSAPVPVDVAPCVHEPSPEVEENVGHEEEICRPVRHRPRASGRHVKRDAVGHCQGRVHDEHRDEQVPHHPADRVGVQHPPWPTHAPPHTQHVRERVRARQLALAFALALAWAFGLVGMRGRHGHGGASGVGRPSSSRCGGRQSSPRLRCARRCVRRCRQRRHRRRRCR
mmetsp:Transcript_28335/g.91778  ORF Transcript_28335/g.91778 Transcript_28335/m.91778 type:complete len:259 (-) Transcript_28335:99-875(-)